jgi:hypothetical protein
MLAQFVASKATRDALFLSEFPATDLPAAMIAAGVVTIGGTVLASRLLARFGPGHVVPFFFLASAGVLVGLWAAIDASPHVVAAALYLHVALFGPLAISGFWSLLSESFDPHSAKTTLARVSAFAALGGIVGGVGANAISSWVGGDNVLVCLALLHAACALGVAAIVARGGEAASAAHEAAPSASGLTVLRRSSYLRGMAGLVVLCAVVDALLDYAFKSAAADAFEAAELIEFFGYYYTATGVLIFLVQASVGARVLRRFGLGGAMGVLPASILGLGTLAVVWPRLIPIVIARAAEAVFSNSLFSAGFQLLYTPLPAADKRPAKPYVDVAAQRAGGIAGGTIILGLLLVAPALPIAVVIGLAVALSGLALWMVMALQRGYVAELERSLRAGIVNLSASDALDATTAHTLAGTGLTVDRATVLEQIRARRAEMSSASSAAGAEAADPASVQRPSARADLQAIEDALAVEDALFLERARGLLGDDPSLVRELLTSGPRDPRLAPIVISLLGRDDLGDAPLRHLQKLSTRISGQLLDALLGHDHPVELRRRLPRCLERCPGAGVLPRLVSALDDPDLVVRWRAAQTAVRMIARAPDLALERDRVHAWVHAALAEDEAELQRAIGALERDAWRSVFGFDEDSPPRSPRVELAFTLLALAQPLEVVRAAVHGIDRADPMLRGTALEYLETTLPASLFQAFFEMVRREGETAPPKRAPEARGKDAAAELLQTSRALKRPIFDEEV